MHLALLVLALLTTQAIAIEQLPWVEKFAAIFKGEVVSVEWVQALTNRSETAQLYAARIKVSSVTKQDATLANEVTVYYVHDKWQVCPRCVDLKAAQTAKFYCYRINIAGKTNVLSLPMATFVESPT